MTDYAETLLRAQKAIRLLAEYAERGDNLRAQWQAETIAHCGIALEQYFDQRQREKVKA